MLSLWLSTAPLKLSPHPPLMPPAAFIIPEGADIFHSNVPTSASEFEFGSVLMVTLGLC